MKNGYLNNILQLYKFMKYKAGVFKLRQDELQAMEQWNLSARKN